MTNKKLISLYLFKIFLDYILVNYRRLSLKLLLIFNIWQIENGVYNGNQCLCKMSKKKSLFMNV